MKKDKPFNIRIPSPCNQDWNDMPLDNGGRYCRQCTQVIHDFSQMPDKELLQYFKTYPGTTCGRFHKHQLNRDIQAQKERWSLPIHVRKIAAAFLATLSFRTATAQVDKTPAVPAAMQPAAIKKNTIPESIIISGKITKGNEVPVANAIVSVDTSITVYTDAEGKFSIPLTGDLITTHNLYFSYEGLERTVRTFHPLMGSTNYEVRLMSKEDYRYDSYTMGAAVGYLEFQSLSLAKSPQKLDKENLNILWLVAEKLKTNPSVKIVLISYYGKAKEKNIVAKQLTMVRNYLVNKAGIDESRIKKTIEPGKYVKVVDILEDQGD